MKRLLLIASFACLGLQAIAQTTPINNQSSTAQPNTTPNPNLYPPNYPNPSGVVQPSTPQVALPPMQPSPVQTYPNNGDNTNGAGSLDYNSNRQNSPGNTATPAANAPARDGYLNSGSPDQRGGNTISRENSAGNNTNYSSPPETAPGTITQQPAEQVLATPTTAEQDQVREAEVRKEVRQTTRKRAMGTGARSSRSGRTR